MVALGMEAAAAVGWGRVGQGRVVGDGEKVGGDGEGLVLEVVARAAMADVAAEVCECTGSRRRVRASTHRHAP